MGPNLDIPVELNGGGRRRHDDIAPPLVPRDQRADPRAMVVFVVDCSGSMIGPKIDGLNKAMAEFAKVMDSKAIIRQSVEFCVVTCPPVEVQTDWSMPDEWKPVAFQAGQHPEGTPLCRAIDFALDHAEARKHQHQAVGRHYYQPIVIALSDGWITDEHLLPTVSTRIRDLHDKNKARVWGLFLEDRDMPLPASEKKEAARQFNSLLYAQPLTLSTAKYDKFFEWLGMTIKATSDSPAHTGGDPTLTVPVPRPDFGSPLGVEGN